MTPDPFTFEFPVWVICREVRPTGDGRARAVGLAAVTLADGRTALPLFTDAAAAGQYRDDHAPDWATAEMPDPAALRALLEAGRDDFAVVLFDPYRAGFRARGVPAADLLRMLPA
jgi:hypothetical protein